MIRALTAQDWDAWFPLWEKYLEFYKSEVPETTARQSFAAMVDDTEGGRTGLLAFDGKTPIGFANVIFHDHNWHVQKVCYLQDLFVDPDQRGTGLGRKLIEATYELADARGAANVYWLTQDSNTTARALYDRVGRLTEFIKYQR